MPTLHDAAVRRRLESRLAALRADAPRKWGRMTAAQMLWHVNLFLSYAVGDATAERHKPPMPLPLLRFLVLYTPWPKGAPTHPSAVCKGDKDFETERARCAKLIERFASKPIDTPWPLDAVFGSTSGKFHSKLQAKHLDHHFRQFGS
jgi:hypothetical protein